MIVLVDMDGVLADFERGFYTTWRNTGHVFPAIKPEFRRQFYVRDDYPDTLRHEVESIYIRAGFYQNLPVITGAKEAMLALLQADYDVRICTSPLTQYRHCVPEKYEWVEREFGSDFVTRIIVTKDKTLVRGDVLIDDNPHIIGAVSPQWRHILFDQPYNRHCNLPRLNWSNWQARLKKIAE